MCFHAVCITQPSFFVEWLTCKMCPRCLYLLNFIFALNVIKLKLCNTLCLAKRDHFHQWGLIKYIFSCINLLVLSMSHLLCGGGRFCGHYCSQFQSQRELKWFIASLLGSCCAIQQQFSVVAPFASLALRLFVIVRGHLTSSLASLLQSKTWGFCVVGFQMRKTRIVVFQ